MSHASFVSEALLLQASVQTSSESATRQRKARRQRCLDAVFQARPCGDLAVRSVLQSRLIPLALQAVGEKSSVLCHTLKRLIAVVLSSDDEDDVWANALFVVLSTSLVASPALLVPRLYLSQLSIRLTEGSGQRNAGGWCEGSLIVDPVIKSTFDWMPSELASVARGTQQRRQPREANLHVASVPPPGEWDIPVCDPVELELAAASKWEERLAHEFSTKRIHTNASVQQSCVAELRETPKPVHSIVVFHCAKRSLPSAHASHLCGVVTVAALFAVVGKPDPFGLIVASPTHCIPGTQARLLVMNSCLPKQVPGLLSVVTWAAEKGNLYNALTAVSQVVSRHETRRALGQVGYCAVAALSGELNELLKRVASLASSAALTMSTTSFADVLNARSTEWHRSIAVPLEVLATCFAVTVHDPLWSLTTSVDALSSGPAFISSLYERILRHQAVTSSCTSDHVTLSQGMAVMNRVLHAATLPITSMLTRWVHTGDLVQDPFDEFFIIPSYGETSTGFRVVQDRLPSCIDFGSAERYLQAGVARANYLRALSNLLRQKRRPQEDAPLSSLRCNHTDVLDVFREVQQRLVAAPCQPALDAWSSACSTEAWDTFLTLSTEPLEQIRRDVRVTTDECETQFTNTEVASAIGDSAVESKDRGFSGSVEVALPFAELRNQHAEKNLTVDSSDTVESSPTTLRYGDPEVERMKEVVAERMLREHAERMRILQLQENILRWKTRRAGLLRARHAAVKGEVEWMKNAWAAVYNAPRTDEGRLTPVRQFVVPLAQTADADVSQVPVVPVVPAWDETPQVAGCQADAAQLDFSQASGLVFTVPDSVAAESCAEVARADVSDVVGAFDDEPAALGPATTNVSTPPKSERPLEDDDPLAPIPMTEEEAEEEAGVGVASQHYHHIRQERLIQLYEKREKALLNECEIVGTEDFFAHCTQHCSDPVFLGTSCWSPQRMHVSQTTTLDEAMIIGEENSEDNKMSLQAASTVKPYFTQTSHLISLFYVRRCVQLLLHPHFGALRRTLLVLERVCLLQHGAIAATLLMSFEDAAFPRSDQQHFSAEIASSVMSSAFRSAMEAALDTEELSSASQALQLELTFAGGDGGREAATPFELLPKMIVEARNSYEEDTDEHVWLLPSHVVKRYGDLFVCLIFWRWTRTLLDLTWRAGAASRNSDVWLFCTVARCFVTPVIDFVWHHVSQCCADFRTAMHNAPTTSLLASLDELTAAHDAFLGTLYHVALLSPSFSRLRKQLRALVRIVEEVYWMLCRNNSALHVAGAPQVEARRRILHGRLRDFCLAADIFVSLLCDTATAEHHDTAANSDSKTYAAPMMLLAEHLRSVLAGVRQPA